jgi:hypothetical protein
VPVITAITPSPVILSANGAAIPLTITGRNFGTESTVRLDNKAVPPTAVIGVGDTVLTLQLSPNDLGAARTAKVKVVGQSGESTDMDLVILAPAPVINSIDPTAVPAGSDATLTITGQNLGNGVTVRLGDTDMPATVITSASDTSLTVQLPAAQLSTSGAAKISVVSASGVSSGPKELTIQ